MAAVRAVVGHHDRRGELRTEIALVPAHADEVLCRSAAVMLNTRRCTPR
jgi:hypothetical protein